MLKIRDHLRHTSHDSKGKDVVTRPNGYCPGAVGELTVLYYCTVTHYSMMFLWTLTMSLLHRSTTTTVSFFNKNTATWYSV
jgi:hypothetical protein